MTLKIAIAGVGGRMGQALLRAAGEDFAIAGGTEREGSPKLGAEIAPACWAVQAWPTPPAAVTGG